MNKTKAHFQRFCLWAGAHPLLCALLFFALSIAARMAVNYRLGITTLNWHPDEFRFLHLAKSIAQRGELLIMGEPTNYQKLLYPLLISPAFALVKDPLWQMRLVGIINVVTMSSAVFPAALLVKRLSGKGEVLLITLAALVVMPEFLYTATIMSEALYLPLCLWAFYIFMLAMDENGRVKRPLWFALFGFVLYLTFFTKEVALVFFIAAAGVLVFEGIRDRRDKGKLAQNGFSLLAFAVTFFALFLLMRWTLFHNQTSIYTDGESEFGVGDQLTISALFSAKPILYLPYSAAVMLTAGLLSFCVLPVLLPLFGFKSLDEPKKRLYIFSASSVVIMAATVAYTISIREDLWYLVPRLHMRYFFPLAVPFMILCFDFLLSESKVKPARGKAKLPPKNSAEQLLSKRTISVIVACASALIALLVQTYPHSDSPYDYFSMGATKLAVMTYVFGASEVVAAFVWNLFKLFLIALLCVSVRRLFQGTKKALFAVLCCVVLMTGIWDNFCSFQTIKVFKRSRDPYLLAMEAGDGAWSVAKDIVLDGELPHEYGYLAKVAVPVAKYIENLEGITFKEDIIACLDDKYLNMLETYISQHKPMLLHLSTLDVQYYQRAEGEIPVDPDGKVYYIIVTDVYNPFTNVEVMYESGPYIVLKNLDPTKLLLSPEG